MAGLIQDLGINIDYGLISTIILWVLMIVILITLAYLASYAISRFLQYKTKAIIIDSKGGNITEIRFDIAKKVSEHKTYGSGYNYRLFYGKEDVPALDNTQNIFKKGKTDLIFYKKINDNLYHPMTLYDSMYPKYKLYVSQIAKFYNRLPTKDKQKAKTIIENFKDALSIPIIAPVDISLMFWHTEKVKRIIEKYKQPSVLTYILGTIVPITAMGVAFLLLFILFQRAEELIKLMANVPAMCSSYGAQVLGN